MRLVVEVKIVVFVTDEVISVVDCVLEVVFPRVVVVVSFEGVDFWVVCSVVKFSVVEVVEFVPPNVVFSVEIWVLVLLNVEAVAMGVDVLPSDEIVVVKVVAFSFVVFWVEVSFPSIELSVVEEFMIVVLLSLTSSFPDPPSPFPVLSLAFKVVVTSIVV